MLMRSLMYMSIRMSTSIAMSQMSILTNTSLNILMITQGKLMIKKNIVILKKAMVLKTWIKLLISSAKQLLRNLYDLERTKSVSKSAKLLYSKKAAAQRTCY